MKLYFITEARFFKDKEGHIYGLQSFGTDMWNRYLEVFSEITVIARIQSIQSTEDIPTMQLSDCDKVTFYEIPYYVGILQYLKKKRLVDQTIQKFVEHNKGIYICRVPGVLGETFAAFLRKNRTPYGVEVVGDPWDVYAPGVISHPLRPILRYKGMMSLKKVVQNAAAALYVTQKTLQKRYPVKSNVFQTFASNVKIESTRNAFEYNKSDTLNILSIGSLEQMYKAPDVFLKVVKKLHDAGIQVSAKWLGDGIYKKEMIELSVEMKIDHIVTFEGNKSREDVQRYLKNADIFLLTSRTEGLPRVIVEAMSFALPCVSSRVGGCSELLEESVLVRADDVDSFADILMKLNSNRDFYEQQAKRNLLESSNFLEERLKLNRHKFYNSLINTFRNAHTTLD
jgi:glycosyltransferase involved in cell wall biosynthesis